MRKVRVLLVGNDGVGKSSLVTSLVKDSFVNHLNHVVPEVIIPPQWTRENVTTHIVDSSARPENRSQLEAEIKRADVICLVYSVVDYASFTQIVDFWLPWIRKLGRNIPIVLVGNKVDLREDQTTLEQQVLPIMNEFKEVETCVECSCKNQHNVSEVFYFAQKAVLHPTAPLYDAREHTLKPACVDALRRIFKLCDKDKDGVLDDDEINMFQLKCFESPLQSQELLMIKQVVEENEPQGITRSCLNEVGFLYLHTLFIQRGRLETTWTVLRKFGYGDDLSLREDFLWPPIQVPSNCSVELSSDGYRFFTELFQSFDGDKDGTLKDSELEELFSTAPQNPWEQQDFPETTITAGGSVTLQGFLAQWSMTTLLDYKTTLAYLAYLGYDEHCNNPLDDLLIPSTPSTERNTLNAIRITKQRRSDRRKGKTNRNVFLCYVLGATGSGKTSLLRSFVGKKFNEHYQPTMKQFSVVNSVEIGGAEKYLVMQEIGPKFDSEVLQNKKRLDACDVLCFVYDSSDVNSFSYVAGLRSRFKLDHIPCVFIATKSDCDLVQQRYSMQPDAYCRDLGISVPVSVSMKQGMDADVYHLLVGIAMDPAVGLGGPFRSIGYMQQIVQFLTGKEEKEKKPQLIKYTTIGSVTVCVGAVVIGWLIYRFQK